MVVVSLVLVILGIATTGVLTNVAASQRKQSSQENQQRQSDRIANYIDDRMTSYDQILVAASGIVNVQGAASLTSQDWTRFTSSLRLDETYPEILGVGYADYVTPAQRAAYVAARQKSGQERFAITPSGVRSAYTPIRYIQPSTTTNQGVIGYDMYSEDRRRSAMQTARDSGRPAITEPLALLQDQDDGNAADTPASVLIYYPIYSTGDAPAAQTEKREALAGYVYIALRIDDMMRGVSLTSDGYYTITDITGDAELPIFSLVQGPENATDGAASMAQINAFNRTWQSKISLVNPLVNTIVSPALLFAFGLICSAMLGGTAFGLLSQRMWRVQTAHQQELQRTKDEILALTSHQLRTPASGVKQYIGMLLQGYFGNLTAEQQTIAQKAYNANDRQLEVIDQILYVAKADAGQLLLSTESFDVVALMREVKEGLQQTAAAKSITIDLSAPGRLAINGDARYVRMVFENLISNAIKYSYRDSRVHISIRKKKRVVHIAVTDHGVGISAADQARLFHKFERIDNPLSRSEGGSGLGLFLAERLAKAHKGSIRVDSKEGKGSTFTVTLAIKTVGTKNVAQLTDAY